MTRCFAPLFGTENILINQRLCNRKAALVAIFPIRFTQQPYRKGNCIAPDKTRRVAPFFFLTIPEQPRIVIKVCRRTRQKRAILPAGDIFFCAVHRSRGTLGQPVFVQPADIVIRPRWYIGKRMRPVTGKHLILRAEQTREHRGSLGTGQWLFQFKTLFCATKQAKVVKHLRLCLSIARITVVNRADVCRSCGERQHQAGKTNRNQLFHTKIPFRYAVGLRTVLPFDDYFSFSLTS